MEEEKKENIKKEEKEIDFSRPPMPDELDGIENKKQTVNKEEQIMNEYSMYE